MQEIATTITSIGTLLIAYLTLKLQKKIKEEKDNTKKEEYIRHTSDIYYFLNDISYIINNNKYNSIKLIISSGKEYMHDINFIRYKIISNEEFKLLREIYLLFDEIKRNNRKEDINKLSNIINSNSINNILNKLENIMNLDKI